MHCGRKGKAGSKKPLNKEVPSWMTRKPEEIELLVTKLAKQDLSSSMIGMVLRDSYGIPDVMKITGKSICQILAANKLSSDIPEDLDNLIKRATLVKKHLDVNKKDQVSKRGLQLIKSKIRRLEKYYKQTKRLKESWKYAYTT